MQQQLEHDNYTELGNRTVVCPDFVTSRIPLSILVGSIPSRYWKRMKSSTLSLRNLVLGRKTGFDQFGINVHVFLLLAIGEVHKIYFYENDDMPRQRRNWHRPLTKKCIMVSGWKSFPPISFGVTEVCRRLVSQDGGKQRMRSWFTSMQRQLGHDNYTELGNRTVVCPDFVTSRILLSILLGHVPRR